MRTGLSLVLAIAAFGGVGGCSGPAGGDSLASGDTSAALEIQFPAGYSAYDGASDHQFKIPATVVGVAGLKWSVSDPSLVDLEVQNDGAMVMLTTKGAGQVTITAKSGSLVGHATLSIRKADPSEYPAGSARYNDGVVWQHGRPPSSDDPNAKRLACTNCHSDGGGHLDIQHTPMQTGGYSDDDLVKIMTTGTKPPGVQQRVMPFDKWHAIHQWQMTQDEQLGLITYLRSLEPKSQGPVDFGGHGPGGGGGHWDAGAGASGGGTAGDAGP